MTSVITPTSNTNQPKENAIITTQEQATVSPFRLMIDNEISNRTKVARLAKNAMAFDFVVSTAVGQFFAKTAAAYPDHREACVVRYHAESVHALAKTAGVPFVVYAAYFNRDEAIAFEYATTEDPTPLYANCTEWRNAFIITVGDKEYSEHAVRNELRGLVCHDGDQAAVLRHRIARQNEERATQEAHEAAIAEAHAKRDNMAKYYAGYVLEKAARVGGVIPDGEYTSHRVARADALAAVTDCYVRELFSICEDLNKTRAEARYVYSRHGEDQYGFVTFGEVTAHILTRWVEDGFGDVERGVRNAIAREFVRQYLS